MDVLDKKHLLENADGDPAVLAEIVNLFFDSSHEMLEAIRAAVVRADSDAINRGAHDLRGALSNVGAHAATRAAQELEGLGRRGSMTGLEDAMFSLEHEMDRLEPELKALIRSARG